MTHTTYYNKSLFTESEQKLLDAFATIPLRQLPKTVQGLLMRDESFVPLLTGVDLFSNNLMEMPTHDYKLGQENWDLFEKMWPAHAVELLNENKDLKDEMRAKNYSLYKKYFPDEA